jgi:hypothetical protein
MGKSGRRKAWRRKNLKGGEGKHSSNPLYFRLWLHLLFPAIQGFG